MQRVFNIKLSEKHIKGLESLLDANISNIMKNIQYKQDKIYNEGRSDLLEFQITDLQNQCTVLMDLHNCIVHQYENQNEHWDRILSLKPVKT